MVLHLFSSLDFGTESENQTIESKKHSGFLLGFLVLRFANYKLIRKKSPKAGLSALLLYHVSLVLYSISIILDSLF